MQGHSAEVNLKSTMDEQPKGNENGFYKPTLQSDVPTTSVQQEAAGHVSEWTPIHWAAFQGHLEVLQQLLNQKDLMSPEYENLLSTAAEMGHVDCVVFLLDSGADLDRVDASGRNALHKALFMAHFEVARVLLTRGVDPRAVDVGGRSPMHFAAYNQEPNLVRLVMDYGGNVQVEDREGRTPLHYAATHSSIRTTIELLRSGADLWHRDRRGISPVDLMPAKTLREYLDTFVVKQPTGENEDAQITISFQPFNNKPEWERLMYLLRSNRHRAILKHPVITTFVLLKWKRALPFFMLNFIFYVCFVMVSSVFAIAFIGEHDPEHLRLLWIMCIVFFVLMLIRELYQLLHKGIFYFLNIENYVEMLIVWLAGAVLFLDGIPESTKKSCVILWPLLTWVDLAFLIGRFPAFTKYIAMFTTVAKNYVKVLVPFSFIIAGFILAFYLTLQQCTEHTCSSDLYRSFPMAASKTVLMMLGEMDLADLPFGHLLTSTLILVLIFMFFIMLVLMNLLDALAVSDTQKIADEAELYGIMPLVRLVCYVEDLFWKPRLSSCINRCLTPCCCCFPLRYLQEAFNAVTHHNLILPSLPGCQITLNMRTGELFTDQQTMVSSVPSTVLDILARFLEAQDKEMEETQLNRLQKDIVRLELIGLNNGSKVDEFRNSVHNRLEEVQKQLERILALMDHPSSPVESDI